MELPAPEMVPADPAQKNEKDGTCGGVSPTRATESDEATGASARQGAPLSPSKATSLASVRLPSVKLMKAKQQKRQ